jgi:hypothetical protein
MAGCPSPMHSECDDLEEMIQSQQPTQKALRIARSVSHGVVWPDVAEVGGNAPFGNFLIRIGVLASLRTSGRLSTCAFCQVLRRDDFLVSGSGSGPAIFNTTCSAAAREDTSSLR